MSRVARLGVFIVVTLALLGGGVFLVGSQKYLFSSTYRLKAQFDTVAGLTEGADVQVGGVHSGTVTGIKLPTQPGGKVLVLMELAKPTRAIIKMDSVASIQTEGLLGNQYLSISFGSAGQPDVKDGEMIQSEPPLEMADLLRKTNGILDGSQQAIENAALATGHLNSVSAKMDAGQGTVGALVNDKQLYNNLEQTTATLQSTMVQAQAGVTDFQENMEAMKHNFLLSGYFKKRGYEDAADLSANQIGGLPQGAPLKAFAFTTKQLFNGHDSVKLKSQKSLNAGGEFLAQNEFGFAVVVVSMGMEGDAQKDLVLTQTRAMVIRRYLVENFAFDDAQLKTLGMGKQTSASTGGVDGDSGSIQILVFPEGTQIPAAKPGPTADSEAPRPARTTAAATVKP
jgi:phospholipid/cholesterol/gamma-HCH transport system substrate-binding protein